MNHRQRVANGLCATFVLGFLLLSASPQSGWADTPVNAVITYQGQLKSDGSSANGAYDLEFRLFDAAQPAVLAGHELDKPKTTWLGVGFGPIRVANKPIVVELK